MGNVQPSKLVNSEEVVNLSYLDDGQFAKIYKGQFSGQQVTVKVPRVPENIRKEKSKTGFRPILLRLITSKYLCIDWPSSWPYVFLDSSDLEATS